MTPKQKWTLADALETVLQALRIIDFYGQAAEDNLGRLQGTLIRSQRDEVDRLDYSIQRSREFGRNARTALEEAIKAAVEQQRR